jgi:adenylosuccinate lyase
VLRGGLGAHRGLAATLLAQLAPEHERGLGQWQSQWFTLRKLLSATASGLAAMAEVLKGLEVDALTERLCAQTLREDITLPEAMRADAEVARAVPQAELAALFDAERAFGSAGAMIRRAFAEWRAQRAT